MSAWPDYLDARLRLVHELASSGGQPIDIVDALRLDTTEVVMMLLVTPIEPAVAGSVRGMVTELDSLRERLSAAERAVAVLTVALSRVSPTRLCRSCYQTYDSAVCPHCMGLEGQ